MTTQRAFKGLTCLREREDGLNHRLNLTSIDQVANLAEFGSVRLHDEKQSAHAMRFSLLLGWRAEDGDQQPPFFQGAPGPLHRVTADGVEDDIDVVKHILEAGGRIIDDLVGTQSTQEVPVACRGRPDDIGADPVGQLDGHASDAACCPVDQDALACRKPGMIKKRLPGSQPNQRNSGGLYVIE